MKFIRRLATVCALTGLVVAALAVALYAVEDWRGACAWEKCRRELLSRGERLDAAAFIPPPIPDNQNLAMAPLFTRLYRYRVDPATGSLTFPTVAEESPLKTEISFMPRGEPLKNVPGLSYGSDWTVARAYDLAKWRDYYRARPDFPRTPEPRSPAEDVLLAMTKYAPLLDELSQAADARPLARFPVNWTQQPPWMIAMPHGTAMQNLSFTLRTRAVAALALGRSGEAMRDIALMERLREAEAVDPVLIAVLVEQVQTVHLLQPVWEGLAERRWSAAELGRLQDTLRRIDLLSDLLRAFRCERVTFLAATTDGLKAHGGAARVLDIVENYSPTDSLSVEQRFYGRLFDWVPGGWWDQNKAFGFRTLQDDVIDTVDAAEHHVRFAGVQAAHDAIQHIRLTPYTMLTRVMSLDIYENVTRKTVSAQAGVDQAMVACALERFYLDRHIYPDGLDALTPAYLDRVPPDVIDGAPMRYRVTSEGRYLLYSVGWNGRDDGGQIVWQKDSVRRDPEQGDLVWQYTAPQPPASIQRSK